MKVTEFLEAKKVMEEEIRFATVQAVSKFRGATGYTPRAVNVYMIDKTLAGNATPQHVVGQVKAAVEL